MAEVGPGGLVGDAKSQLNQFCQKFTKKTISKSDYVYETVKFGTQFQTTITIHCLGGESFAGEVADNQKLAEQNAAQIALDHHAADIANLPATSSSNKNKSKSKSAGATLLDPSMNPSMNNRCFLNTALMKILKRPVTKDDLQKNTIKTALGFQTTLAIPNLPGEWANLAWAGEARSNQKDAEESAATYAMEALQADPSMAQVMSLPAGAGKKSASTFGEVGRMSANTIGEAVEIVQAMNPNKRKAADSIDATGVAVNAAMNNRVLLNTSLMKILRRPVTKEDVVKTTIKTALGHQCTISIPALPAEWSGLAWAGEAAPNSKDAEESAATYALEALSADPSFAMLLQAPKAPAKKGKFAQKPRAAVTPFEWQRWTQQYAASFGELS